ncbi:MAG: SCO4848 family membrane protein [Nocardioidaceae bacterium]
MKLERKHAVLFLLIAAWNVLSYANFAKNLAEAAASGADRATGYYVAHIVLIVVNLVIAAVLGRLGWKVWRATGSREPSPASQ